MRAIEICEVFKDYKVYYDKGGSLKEKIIFRGRNTYRINEVLKGINLTIKQGEVLGLIGENGCGKSTLLKLLCKIIYPNKGTIAIQGRVSSLIELGAGFHPDMTGRENIYINASIFGLSKKETDKRLTTMIEFSELEEAIDYPVRTYSSGMYMRLAFSVAINVDADIILVDEILAVGDERYQTKCYHKLEELKEKGTTIVIVSHDLNAIKRLCNRVIWIYDGKIKAEDQATVVIEQYLKEVMKD